jgi:protein TonB
MGAAPRRAGLAATLALHALAVSALLSYEPARTALAEAAPIMIDFISVQKPEERPAEIVPPRPKPTPVVKRPPPPPEPQVLSVEAETPSPMVAPAPPPEPPAPPPPPMAMAAPPAPAPVIPVTPPIFNADYLNNPLTYPAVSRRIREEGDVLLRVLVNAAGSADQVELVTSSGHARLDEAARESVRRWKFVPAKRGEQPVPAWVLVPISFRLEG